MTGLRERKKQQTRQRISDIATGLFLEHGFDVVTIAEIAEAAEVSVNTVYNYFPSKEDLFFDREEEMVERSSRTVRERAPGESAATALLRRLRTDLVEQSGYAGLEEGYARFLRCVRESQTLVAKVFLMQMRMVDRLAETLREEVSADPEDPTPELVAAQLISLNNTVFRTIGRGHALGLPQEELGRQALRRLEVFESLLGAEVLNYATRPVECSDE